jgi:hypothetical protein
MLYHILEVAFQAVRARQQLSRPTRIRTSKYTPYIHLLVVLQFQKVSTLLSYLNRNTHTSKTMQRLDPGDLGVIATQLLLVYTTFLEPTTSINFDPSIYAFLRFLYPWLFVLGIPLLVITFKPVREFQFAVALVWGSSAILINASKYCEIWNVQSNDSEICTHKCANSIVAGIVWVGLAVPIIYWRSWK